MNLQSIAPITNTRCRSCGKMTNVGACARATRDLRIVHSESRSLPCGLRSGNARHVFRASDLVIGYGPVPLSHPLIFSFSSPSPISAQLDHFQSVSPLSLWMRSLAPFFAARYRLGYAYSDSLQDRWSQGYSGSRSVLLSVSTLSTAILASCLSNSRDPAVERIGAIVPESSVNSFVNPSFLGRVRSGQ